MAAAMEDRLLAAQVIMAGIDGNGSLGEPMKALLRAAPAGGIMLFDYNLKTEKQDIRPFLETLSALITEFGVAPFIAVDHEGGSVHRFGTAIERLPPPLFFWDMAQNEGKEYALKAVEESARRSGGELRALGITMNLAPVAEVLNEENRSFLEDRSYGPDAAFAEDAAAAFIRGMSAAGIACVVKHFPGNTGIDPHRAAPVLAGDRETLDRMIRPFAGLMRGVSPSALMVSHGVVPAWDEKQSASLSAPLIRGWIREDLGFTGIVLADDFSMGAVASLGLSPGEAAVEALNAGVDMVMTWPKDLRSLHGAILEAVTRGVLSRERLREAAEHILFEKIRYGLIR
jgi:beta-N-acetylhexosaminidase